MKKTKEKSNPLFAMAADTWRDQVMALYKRSSARSTEHLVRHLIDEFGYHKVGSITKNDIQNYIVKLNTRGVGLSQIKRYMTTFRGIMEYADDEWDMPTRIKLPKAKKIKREFYSFEETRKLLFHARGAEKVLVMMLAESGCRLGEALALQTADIDKEKNTISITKNVYDGVVQYTPKTESSIREVCISPSLMLELSNICLDRSREFVFRTPTGRAMWPQQLTYKFKALCVKAGVTYKAFHAFRRGNITALLNDLSMPERIVGMRVGHLSQGMTLGVYTQAVTGTDRIWVPKIEALLYKGEI